MAWPPLLAVAEYELTITMPADTHQAKSHRHFTFFCLFAFIYSLIYLFYFLFPSAAIIVIMTTIILFADDQAATLKPHAW